MIPTSSADVKTVYTTGSNEEVVIERIAVDGTVVGDLDAADDFDVVAIDDLAEGSGEEVDESADIEEVEGSGETPQQRPPIKADCKRRYKEMWQCYAGTVFVLPTVHLPNLQIQLPPRRRRTRT